MGTAVTDLRRAPSGETTSHDGAADVLRYLVSCGLLSAAEIGDRATRLEDLSSSHVVWSVRRRNQRRLIVKQGRPRPGDRRPELGVEQAIYRLAAGPLTALRDVLPRCRWIDPRRHLLVLDSVEPGETVSAAIQRHGPSLDIARSLGAALALCHSSGAQLQALLPPHRNWVLELFRPGAWRPPGMAALLAPSSLTAELASHFAALEERPRLITLVHGDVRWENCLVQADPGSVRLIDWETAGMGDPAWDVAGVIQEHLRFRIVRPHLSAALDVSLEAFLASYRAHTPRTWLPILTSARRLAGARLIQTALEHVAAGTAPSAAAPLVQLAQIVLRAPDSVLPS